MFTFFFFFSLLCVLGKLFWLTYLLNEENMLRHVPMGIVLQTKADLFERGILGRLHLDRKKSPYSLQKKEKVLSPWKEILRFVNHIWFFF